MKEKDYSKISDAIRNQFADCNYDLNDLIGDDLAEILIMNIYLAGDLLRAHDQSLNEYGLSIITTTKSISIILDGKMSWGKCDGPICLYEDLDHDILNICVLIQFVLDRINS